MQNMKRKSPKTIALALLLAMILAASLLAACKPQLAGENETSQPAYTTPEETTISETTPEETSQPEETPMQDETEPVSSPATRDAPSDDAPVVALTFDDGPNLNGTEALLDLLAAEDVTATFFLLGSQIDAGRESIVERTHAEGHEIANHSYSHIIFTEHDEAAIREEMETTQQLIRQITGEAPTIMRPPTGAYDERVQQISREMDLAIVNWSWQSCPEDWDHHDNPEYIAEFVVENAANGHIVLLHDTNEGTLAAMPDMIDGLKERGFRFMGVSEMLSYLGQGHPEAGAVYTHLAEPAGD